MSDISVLSRTQRIIVDMASSSVSVINAGPSGPGGPQGLQGEEGPQGLPGVSVVVSETAPASPSLGDVWYETTTTLLWVYDGTQWVNASVNTAFDLTVTNDLYVNQNAEIDGTLTANHIHGNIAGSVYLHIKNTSGVTIPAGSPVYATGSVGASGETEVSISYCDAPSTMPALGITATELAPNAEGHATVLGVAKGLDTFSYSVNDSLYVSNSGTLTNVRPVLQSELVQKIGRVIRTDASTGEVLVLGAGRANDVPNSLVSSELVINSGSITINSGDEQLLIGNDPPNENFGAITAWNTNTEARVDLILEGQDVLVYGNSLKVNDTRVPVSGSIYEIVKLTQAQYDALTPDANTLYVIVG